MWLSHGAVTVLAEFHRPLQRALGVALPLLVSVPALSLASLRSSMNTARTRSRTTQRAQRSVLAVDLAVSQHTTCTWCPTLAETALVLAAHGLPRPSRAMLARSGASWCKAMASLISRHGLKAIDSPRHPFA